MCNTNERFLTENIALFFFFSFNLLRSRSGRFFSISLLLMMHFLSFSSISFQLSNLSSENTSEHSLTYILYLVSMTFNFLSSLLLCYIINSYFIVALLDRNSSFFFNDESNTRQIIKKKGRKEEKKSFFEFFFFFSSTKCKKILA